MITIAFDGRSETALLKTMQRDPRSGHILHIDFQAVSLEESVTATVPIRFVGESLAVTKMDGVMTHPRSEVRVTARATDLPDAIQVDVSSITELQGAIHVGDLPPSATYTILDPPEEVLAMVQPPKVEAEVSEGVAEEAGEAAAEAEAPAGEAQSESQQESS
jgi:large subunit ribosomal protein L25